jgi:hypothetical protein
MADSNFKLVIGGYTFRKKINDEDNYKFLLHGVRFNRKIYQPGEIEVEISLSEKETVSELTRLLLMKEVKLMYNDNTIAENYYVHEILPKDKQDDTGIFVKLMIYSMDKLMTLDKYSKVYAGMKLGAEILNKERNYFKLGNAAVEVDFGRIRMLKYMYSRFINDNKQTGKIFSIEIPSEFIQPYLVQYNESFYDFLSRTANRCGEFLYFEDGKLVLGLNTRIETYKETDEKGTEIEKTREQDPILISNYDSITYKSISTSKFDIERYARDTMKDKWGMMEETNYDVVKKNKAGYPHDAFPRDMVYNTELTSDEFFFPLYADKFTTLKREMGGTGTAGEKAATQIFPKLYDITTNSADAVDFVFKLVTDEAKTAGDAGITNAKKNSKGKKNYIEIKEGADRAKMMEKGDGETCIVPFGSLSKDGWTTLDYYRDVRKYEEQLQRDIICIDMGTNYADVKLGDKIKLSKEGDPYTVIQILMVNGNAWTHSYIDYEGNISPMTQAHPNQKIFAIPYLKSGEEGYEVYKPYPPVLDAPVIRKAEPQTAFITASNDPKLQGRVRIVYPWQTDSTGNMRKLADAEAEYEKALKDYLEKKEKQKNLEKELDVLKKEKQLLKDKKDDKKIDKTKDLENIIKKLSEVNLTLEVSKTFEELKADVTEEEIDEAQKEIAPLEVEVNKKEAEVVKRQAKLKSLESEKAPLDKELEELERRKEDLEKENALLQLKYEKETDETKKAKLYDKIEANKEKITSLKTQISGADGTGGLKATIKTKQDIIKDLKDEKSNIKSILYAESLLENEKEKLEAQREKYILLQQKKEIEDYYAELNGPTKKMIIDDQIAVYDSDKNLIGGKKKEVEDAKKATKDAKDELEKKEKAIKDIEKDAKKAIGKMASPWIRMTSPMATDGGGTIFKPRLGDEVLVNYECGNVERPYVVGSLFSKNVLEPDERINREVGPNLHKGASIAIVSPNGHGITFKDPSSDAGFAASVYPGIGVINNLIIDNIPDVEWPKSKDLAGGIRIGDRYGLYSIDMSSDKRSVKISSSLGTVSLNAFTGITISAPNGDIKIEGKNVSIKAGNNLTLTSGTNIETRSKRNKKFDSGAAFGYTLEEQGVNRLLKEFVTPFIDVSLARSVWEIILMPIEGTTQIKSHRYMKLEAGSGNATIKHDRYKKDDLDKQVLTRQLVGWIKEISTTIDSFCSDYKTKWDNYDTAINNYKKDADKYLLIDDDPKINDIILAAKQAYKTVNGVVQPWKTWNVYNKDIFKDKLQPGIASVYTFYSSADHLGLAVYELTKHIRTFKRKYNYQGLDDVKNRLQAAFEELNTYLQQVWDDNSRKSQFLPSTDNLKKLLKRKWAALFLIKLSESNFDGKLKISYKAENLTDGMLTDNYKWGLFVKDLERKPMLPFRVAVDAIEKSVKDIYSPFANPVKDRLMWNENASGQILLSDNPDYTINFSKGQANPQPTVNWELEEDANQGNLDYVKKLLIGLK